MKCEQCEGEASVHFVEVSGGEKVERHLCDACASCQGTLQPTIHPQPQQYTEALAEGMTAAQALECINEARQHNADDTAHACPECGVSYQQFRRQGRLGCPACYDAFRSQLLLLLDRIHGATHHHGKRPGETNPDLVLELQRHQLKTELDRAVTKEAYEEAARLRDEIREIEARLGLHGAG